MPPCLRGRSWRCDRASRRHSRASRSEVAVRSRRGADPRAAGGVRSARRAGAHRVRRAAASSRSIARSSRPSWPRPNASWRASPPIAIAPRAAQGARSDAHRADAGHQGAARRAVEARPRRLRAAAAGLERRARASGAWRAAWRRSRKSIACGSKRIAARWPPSATRSTSSISKYDEVEALQKDAARARAAVEAAVAARNRMIEDLDRRRDLAAQFVAELQQAQLQLERRSPRAEAGSSVVGAADSALQGRSAVAGHRQGQHAIRTRSRQAVSAPRIVRNGIEVAAAEGTAATAVHEGTVAYRGAVQRIRDAGDRRSRRIGLHAVWPLARCCRECWDERQPRHAAWPRRAGRRPAEPPCISSSASTGARSTRYNG